LPGRQLWDDAVVIMRGLLAFCAVMMLAVVLVNGWFASRRFAFRRLGKRGRVVEGVVAERPVAVAPAGEPGTGVGVPLLVVEFTDEAGTVHQVKSRGGSTGFPDIGARTRVAYDPADPRKAMIEADVVMVSRVGWLLLAIFTPMLVACVLGVIYIE
jgi:hypothetical protein